MRIQPIYDRVEGTPLSFFKFAQFTLVLGLVVRVIYTISLFTSGMNWYSMVYNLISLTLTILALLWLGDMKWKGVLAYCGLFIFKMFDGIAALVICAYYGAFEMIGAAVGQVLAVIIFLVPVWIYFEKRRLLFVPAPKTKKLQEAVQQEPVQSDRPVLQEPRNEDLNAEGEKGKDPHDIPVESRKIDTNPVRFCRNCGCKLAPGSMFCSACGTKIVKEW